MARPKSSALYTHKPRPHAVRNANHVHKEKQQATGVIGFFTTTIALWLTKNVGTMVCAYFFAALAIAGFPGFDATPTQYVQWTSQTFIQLVMLSVLLVAQNVIGKHAEVQADEQFKAVMNTEHDAEQARSHLSEQDKELLKHTQYLEQILKNFTNPPTEPYLTAMTQPMDTLRAPMNARKS
jgi:hypothetical protein